MRVFVTGATGFIGSAVVKELIGAGHQVIGVYRSDDKAPALAAAGAEVYRGSIDDPDSLKDGAARSDGIIHLAFNHDFSQFAANCETDRRVVEALGSVLAGSAPALDRDLRDRDRQGPARRARDRGRSRDHLQRVPPRGVRGGGRGSRRDAWSERIRRSPAPGPRPGAAGPHQPLDRNRPRKRRFRLYRRGA